MRTSELAAKLPEAMLRQFGSSAVWRDAVSQGIAWERAAADPQAVRAAAASLPETMRAVLAALLRHYGPGPFEEDQLAAAAARELRAADVRRGLAELRRAGILFALRKSWGDRLYFMPSDSYAGWLDALHPARLPQAEHDRRAIRVIGEYRSPLSLQLLQALATLAQTGLKLTKRGGLPLRAATAMARRLECRDEELAGLHAAVGGEHAADRDRPITVALDTLIGTGMLARRPEGGALCLDATRTAAWLAAPADVRESLLYAWMFERYAAYEPAYRHAAAALAMLPCGIWYGIERLDEWLTELGTEAAGQWQGWADALCAFGWLQRGRMPDGREALRWTMEPHAAWNCRRGDRSAGSAGVLRFLPGGDIAAPPDLDYRIRWELELLGASTSPGPMAVYRCNAGSVARYVRRHGTLDRALRLLAEGAGGSVPEDLARLLGDWAGEAERSDDAEATSRRNVPAHADQRPHATEPFRLTGIVQPAFEPALLPLDEALPDPVPAVREALGRVPSSWIKQLRDYHPTTRRDMLKQAIALGVSVKLERSGKTIDFTPLGIEEGQGAWQVRGRLNGAAGGGEERLTPDMWQRMQLFVPDSEH